MENCHKSQDHGRSCLPRHSVTLWGCMEPWASVWSGVTENRAKLSPGLSGPLARCHGLARWVSEDPPEEQAHLEIMRDWFAAEEFPCLLGAEQLIESRLGTRAVRAACSGSTGFPSRKAAPQGTFSTAFSLYGPWIRMPVRCRSNKRHLNICRIWERHSAIRRWLHKNIS